MTPDLASTLAACTDFPSILAALFAASYTGPITFHFASGQPKRADVPSPLPATLSVSLERRSTTRRQAKLPVGA